MQSSTDLSTPDLRTQESGIIDPTLVVRHVRAPAEVRPSQLGPICILQVGRLSRKISALS